jgi:MOSC domain-containing protein YiiM
MKSFEELEQLWSAQRAQGNRHRAGQGVVRLISRRLGGGVHESLQRAQVTVASGLVGDSWNASADPERLCQITFMSALAAECVACSNQQPGEAGDNFFVDLDLSEAALPVGARVRLGHVQLGHGEPDGAAGVLLEVTAEPHLGCAKFRERFGADALRWVNIKESRSERRRGVNLRVLEGGWVSVGDVIEVMGVVDVVGSAGASGVR